MDIRVLPHSCDIDFCEHCNGASRITILPGHYFLSLSPYATIRPIIHAFQIPHIPAIHQNQNKLFGLWSRRLHWDKQKKKPYNKWLHSCSQKWWALLIINSNKLPKIQNAQHKSQCEIEFLIKLFVISAAHRDRLRLEFVTVGTPNKLMHKIKKRHGNKDDNGRPRLRAAHVQHFQFLPNLSFAGRTRQNFPLWHI